MFTSTVLTRFFTVFLTTIPGIFQGVYDERPGIAGLHYLALGIGLGGASQLNARTLDRVYSYYKDKNGGRGRPEFRLREFTSAFLRLQSILIFW